MHAFAMQPEWKMVIFRPHVAHLIHLPHLPHTWPTLPHLPYMPQFCLLLVKRPQGGHVARSASVCILLVHPAFLYVICMHTYPPTCPSISVHLSSRPFKEPSSDPTFTATMRALCHGSTGPRRAWGTGDGLPKRSRTFRARSTKLPGGMA